MPEQRLNRMKDRLRPHTIVIKRPLFVFQFPSPLCPERCDFRCRRSDGQARRRHTPVIYGCSRDFSSKKPANS